MRKLLTLITVTLLAIVSLSACELEDANAPLPEKDSYLTWDADSSDVAIKASTCTSPWLEGHSDFEMAGMVIPDVAEQQLAGIEFFEGNADDTNVADCRIQLILEGPAVAESGIWDCRAFSTSVLDFKNLNDSNKRTWIADFNLTR